MEKIANVILYTLGAGAVGGGLLGAAYVIDRLLNLMSL